MLPGSVLLSISALDLVSIVIISLIALFLLIIFRIDTIMEKPKIYLKLALGMVLTLVLIDELIELDFPFAVYLYPIVYFIYFAIYPTIYVYSRDLIFNGQDRNRPPLIVYLIFPFIVLLAISIIFYPLSIDEKLAFVELHISESKESFIAFSIFRMVIIPAYYVQTVFFIVVTFLLTNVAKKRTYSQSTNLLIVRLILIYIVGVIVFEILLLIVSIGLPISVYEIRLIEMVLTLLFVLFGMYVLFNQTIIIVQSRLERFSSKIEESRRELVTKTVFSETEKMEIKKTMEYFLGESKLYLDPNLTLEIFSKRIHIQARKISNVINSTYNKNFHQFINEYRVTASLQIMDSEKEINIENLYTKVGFNSRSTFNRVFKEITGKSPSEYLSQRKSA